MEIVDASLQGDCEVEEILALAPEHHGLGALEADEPPPEPDRRHERNHRDRAGRDGDDRGGAHGSKEKMTGYS